MKRKKPTIVRLAAALALVAAAAGVAYAGWTWLDGLVVERVAVEGHRHAEEAAILAVARVDTGVRLLNVDPAIIADRAARHPWVHSAGVRRLPPGIVRIAVVERAPVALALDAEGRPAVYLDRDGHAMPLAPGAAYDVPLLRGVRLPENKTRPIETPSVVELLRTLDQTSPILDALISSLEVERDGQIVLHTAPAGTQGTVDVRLGASNFAERLERFEAFWSQAVLARPEKRFEVIDLRFDSQIVTTES